MRRHGHLDVASDLRQLAGILGRRAWRIGGLPHGQALPSAQLALSWVMRHEVARIPRRHPCFLDR